MLMDASKEHLCGFLLAWLPHIGRQLRQVLVYSVNQDPEEALDLFGECDPSCCR